MTLEELSLLREILDKVNLIERTLLEVKGFVGFREAAETTIAGGNVIPWTDTLRDTAQSAGTVTESEYPSKGWQGVGDAEDFAHEVQEAPSYAKNETPSTTYYRQNAVPIRDLKVGDAPVKLAAWIEKIDKVTDFDYPSGDKGKVCNILVSDGSGTIKVTLWNAEIDQLEGIKKGDEVDIDAWKVGEDKKKVRHILLGKFGSLMKRGQVRL